MLPPEQAGQTKTSSRACHASEPREACQPQQSWTADAIAVAEETAQRTWVGVLRARAVEALRTGEQELKRARDYAEATLRTSPVPILVLEKDSR